MQPRRGVEPAGLTVWFIVVLPVKDRNATLEENGTVPEMLKKILTTAEGT
jgi:hypothetical protein